MKTGCQEILELLHKWNATFGNFFSQVVVITKKKANKSISIIKKYMQM